MGIRIHLLDEQHTPGQRLGRHVEHDDRSRDYPVELDLNTPLVSKLWQRRSPILNQGQLGSCTGNAAASWLATDTATRTGRTDITENLAVGIYSRATHLDHVKGMWPPADTGSSGLAAAKAMVQLGLTSGPYRHAFSLAGTLRALQTGPVLLGIAWRSGCDNPGAHGLVSYTGPVRGGHETCIVGLDVDARTVRIANSWGPGWGDAGYYELTFDDLATALADQGDVTVPS